MKSWRDSGGMSSQIFDEISDIALVIVDSRSSDRLRDEEISLDRRKFFIWS